MALDKMQQAVIRGLARSGLRRRFYWSGGTLLAEKYLQHRNSYDIDLFTDSAFRYVEVIPFIESLKKTLK